MAITVGEVNAVLTARNDMSAAVQSATQDVKNLEQAIDKVGTTANAKLPEAEAAFSSVAKTFKSIGDSQDSQKIEAFFTKIGQGAQEAAAEIPAVSAGLTEMSLVMGGLTIGATALVGVVGALIFFKTAVDDAKRLSDLNEEMGVSVTKLQQLEGVATLAEIPFANLTKTMESLETRVLSGNGGAGRALEQLGFNLDELKRKTPDEKLDQVSEALSKIQERSIRAGMEIEIFGNDKVDKVVTHLKSFEEESDRLNVKLSTDQVKALKQAGDELDGYGRTLEGVLKHAKALAEIDLANALKGLTQAPGKATGSGVAGFLQGIMPMLSPMFISDDPMTKFITNMVLGNVSGYGPAGPGGAKEVEPPSPPPSDTHETLASNFMEQTRRKSAPSNISPQLDADLSELKSLNQLTLENAKAVGASEAQYRTFSQELKQADEFMKGLFETMKKKAEFDELQLQRHLSVDDRQQSMIEGRYAMGQSAETIAADLNLPVPTIQRVVKEIEQVTRALKDTEKQAVETAKGIAQAVSDVSSAQARVLAATGQSYGGGGTPFEAALSKRDTQMAAATTRANQTFSGPQAEKMAEANDKAARAEMAASEAEFEQATAAAAKGIGALEKPTAAMAKGIGDFNSNLSKLGGVMVPTTEELEKGGYFQNTISAHGLDNSLSIAGGTAHSKARTFADGGPTTEGPAYLHDSEYVVPSGGALVMRGSSGGGTTVHVNMSGLLTAGDPGARAALGDAVNTAVMSALRQGRQLPNR